VADNLDHLEFQPISRPVRERKKSRSYPPRIVRYRSPGAHAGDLLGQVDRLIAQLQEQERPQGTAPKQVVEVQAQRRINEQRLAKSGLIVLDSSVPESVVAVTRDTAMTTMRERLAEYAEGEDLPDRPAGATGPDEGPRAPYEDVFDGIDGFERRAPEDRISDRLRELLNEPPDGGVDVIADLYSPEDAELRQAWIDEVGLLARRRDVTVDGFDDPAIGVTLIRLTADAALVGELSQLDQIATLDTPAVPALTPPNLAELQDLESSDPDIEGPDEDAPAIGIIDSGLTAGHPFLQAAVLGADGLHPVFGGAGEDGFGHGTMVAGLALYGDVLECARLRAFVAPFPIASVRIFDDDGRIPEGVNPASLLQDALEHLVEEYDCRVICLSLGDHNQPFLGGKASPLAALIDDLARALNIVVVLPTGNLQHETLIAPAQLLARWPTYLADPGNEMLSPSQAALALTVGAVADRDATDLTDAAAAVAATAGGPAPYARRGPGVRDAQKPEVVADGGNWVYDRRDGTILDDTGTAVLSLSARSDLLFDTAIGSSFAAARVAHVAGQIASRYPHLSAAAIRALLLQGCHAASPPDGIENAESLLGHGKPSLERCLASTDSRVVLVSESNLRPNGFHVYRLAGDTDFMTVSGSRHITVGLSFDPPVRYRRYDYLAYQMEFAVVRGLSEEEVFHLASSDNVGTLRELSKRYLDTRPTTTRNARCVNQLARVTYSRRPAAKFQHDWYIVVRSLNRWMRDRSPQPYALAVAVEVEESARLYGQLRAEVEVRARVRARF